MDIGMIVDPCKIFYVCMMAWCDCLCSSWCSCVDCGYSTTLPQQLPSAMVNACIIQCENVSSSLESRHFVQKKLKHVKRFNLYLVHASQYSVIMGAVLSNGLMWNHHRNLHFYRFSNGKQVSLSNLHF